MALGTTSPSSTAFSVVGSTTPPLMDKLLLGILSVLCMLLSSRDNVFHEFKLSLKKLAQKFVKTKPFFSFQEFFPGIIHTVFVLRPASFLQKALSEVSSKLFKEEFRFRVLVCSSVEELYEHFDRTQLTPDLGGELQYSHAEWIQQRIVSYHWY